MLVASSLGLRWHTVTPVSVSPMSRSGSFSAPPAADAAAAASVVPSQQEQAWMGAESNKKVRGNSDKHGCVTKSNQSGYVKKIKNKIKIKHTNMNFSLSCVLTHRVAKKTPLYLDVHRLGQTSFPHPGVDLDQLLLLLV